MSLPGAARNGRDMASIDIYTSREYLPPGRAHVAMLYPFWGISPEDPADPCTGRFDEYARTGKAYFAMAPLAQAAVAVAPCEWLAGQENELIRRLAVAARGLGKRTVIFFNNDSTEPIEVEGALVFRTSLYRSRRRKSEFAQPAWSEDFLQRHTGGEVPLREKTARPVVGYCGYSRMATGQHEHLRGWLGARPGIARWFERRGMQL